jgi:hypothetical protein
MNRRMMLWIKGNSRLTPEETQWAFKNRRKKGWLLFLAPFVTFSILVLLQASRFIESNFAFVITIFVFFVMFFYALVYYRCPRCGTTPTSSRPGTTGVLLFPKRCSKCKAPLLPDHRWAQD